MNTQEKLMVLQIVETACSKDPSIVKDIIVAATDGVKRFAESQSDRSSKIAFRLFSVLDSMKVSDDKPGTELNRFGPFSAKEVLDELAPSFGGTPALKQLKEKFNVKE